MYSKETETIKAFTFRANEAVYAVAKLKETGEVWIVALRAGLDLRDQFLNNNLDMQGRTYKTWADALEKCPALRYFGIENF